MNLGFALASRRLRTERDPAPTVGMVMVADRWIYHG